MFNAKAKKAFKELKWVFSKVSILRHFDPLKLTRMETDALRYIVKEIMSQPFKNAKGKLL